MRMGQIIPAAFMTIGLTAVSFGAAQAADKVEFGGLFTGEHSATSQPHGDVKATLDPDTNKLSYSIRWRGLSGPVQAAHFHGPASPDQDADVIAPIDGPYNEPLKGTVQLDSEQVAEVMKGQVYVNLHTQAFPNGEARAQLVKQ
ncbi:CHRD domain-containing protein [Acetobacter estunensis]|uniref:CHRD domain-containing protein n=1 Tax=Acetobacter estunensis TaxID=104097 RepID=A0A967B4X6_9PROT|nr:CHRD domain-containing protein [Acetobacter estunensis]